MKCSKIEFPVTGEWWVPATPDNKCAGKLNFDEFGDLFLESVGRFLETGNYEDGLEWIHGYIPGVGKLSLYGCDVLESRGISTERGGETRSCLFVMIGDHLNSESAVFTAGAVQLEGLDEFVSRERINIETDSGTTQVSVATEKSIPLFSNGEVSGGLDLGYSYSGGGYSVTLNQVTGLNLNLKVGKSAGHIMGVIKDFSNLLTIAVGRPAATIDLSVRPSSKDKWIDVISSKRYPRMHAKRRRGFHLFSMKDLGEKHFDIVTKWMELSGEYRPVINLALAGVYNTHVYLENDIANLINALEGFHRRAFGNSESPEEKYISRLNSALACVADNEKKWLFGKLKYRNETPLIQRLMALRSYAGIEYKGIDDLSDGIVERIVATRNSMAHNDKANEQCAFRNDELSRLKEMLRTWVHCCLLRLIGLNQEDVARMFRQKEQRFVGWLARRYPAN